MKLLEYLNLNAKNTIVTNKSLLFEKLQDAIPFAEIKRQVGQSNAELVQFVFEDNYTKSFNFIWEHKQVGKSNFSKLKHIEEC